MKVRCGRCRSDFEVGGPGQYTCPSCGTINQIGAAAGMPPAGGPGMPPAGGPGPPPPPPPPPPPALNRVVCGACGYSFAVGPIDLAICPNCTSEVPVPGGGPVVDVLGEDEL